MNYPDNMNHKALDEPSPEMQEALEQVRKYESVLVRIIRQLIRAADILGQTFTKDDAHGVLATLLETQAFAIATHSDNDLGVYPPTPINDLIELAFNA